MDRLGISNELADRADVAALKEQARLERLASSGRLPKELRGTPAAIEAVQDAILAGASDKQIRRMLRDEGVHNYIAGRQQELNSAQLDSLDPKLAVQISGFGTSAKAGLHLASADQVQAAGVAPTDMRAHEALHSGPIGPTIITRPDGTRTDGFGVLISGAEPLYEPDRWNAPGVIDSNNCYSYALDDLFHPRDHIPQPGERAGNVEPYMFRGRVPDSSIIDVDLLLEAIERDGQAKFLGTTPESTLKAPKGTYIVALVVDNRDLRQDYHWYRHNPDGSWSGKSGTSRATNLDFGGNVILDPRIANRTYGPHGPGILEYNRVIGYYAVRPGAQVGPRRGR